MSANEPIPNQSDATRDLIWPDGTVVPANLRGEDNATTVRAMLARLERASTP